MSVSAPQIPPKESKNRFRALFDSDLFTYRELRDMFLPLMLDQLFIYVISMLSTALVSSVGQEAIAAVNMVSSIGFIVSSIFFAIAMGGSILIAQAKGSGDLEKMRCAIGQTAFLCGGVALVLSALLIVFAEPLVYAIYPKAEPLLTGYAIKYLRLVSLSQLPYGIFHALFTAFRSIGDARSSLVLTIFINVAHLIFSLLFINGLGMGIEGAGLSYILARVIWCAVALAWLLGIHNTLGMKARHFFRFTRKIVGPEVRLAIPFGVEQVLFQGGMLLVQMYLAGWGETPQKTTVALAAHAVAASCFNLFYAAPNAITTMTSTVCGQCIGAGRIDLSKRYCRSMITAGNLVALVSTALLLALSPLILQLYHPSAEALPVIYRALFIAGIPLPLLWCRAFVTPTMLRAAGDANYTTLISLTALLLGRIGLGYFLTVTCNLGVPGIWIGQLFEWIFRAVMMEFRFRSDKWQRLIPKKAQA